MHFAKHSAANALIDGWKSVELCQAYILMSIYAVPARRWEEDRSWLYTGLAIRSVFFSFHIFCEMAFVNWTLFFRFLSFFLLGLLPIWICITFRPRFLRPRNKNVKCWTRFEFGWYASIWIDRLQHSSVNRQQSRKTSTLFDSFSILSFFIKHLLVNSIVRNGKEWYKKSQYNTTVSPIDFSLFHTLYLIRLVI